MLPSKSTGLGCQRSCRCRRSRHSFAVSVSSAADAAVGMSTFPGPTVQSDAQRSMSTGKKGGENGCEAAH